MSFSQCDLNQNETLHLDSKPFTVEEGRIYEAKCQVLGTIGQKFSSYFAIIFLDKDGNEIIRRIVWINDFSGKIKEYKVRCKAEKGTRRAVVAYRVNCEEVFPSEISMKITNSESITLERVENMPENYDIGIHYAEWQRKRINFITKSYTQYFKTSKTLVNMGALYGDLAFLVSKKFRHISCLNEEGRQKNLAIGTKRHFEFDWKLVNYENCDLLALSKADIVINMGLFYHLSVNKAKDVLLASIGRANKIVFFETEIIDCDNEDCYIETSGTTNDITQALCPLEIKPSIPYINNIVESSGLNYDFIESPELNGDGHTYDWFVNNTKKWTSMKRKMWVIKKE